jgi:hypothetical protein
MASIHENIDQSKLTRDEINHIRQRKYSQTRKFRKSSVNSETANKHKFERTFQNLFRNNIKGSRKGTSFAYFEPTDGPNGICKLCRTKVYSKRTVNGWNIVNHENSEIHRIRINRIWVCSVPPSKPVKRVKRIARKKVTHDDDNDLMIID